MAAKKKTTTKKKAVSKRATKKPSGKATAKKATKKAKTKKAATKKARTKKSSVKKASAKKVTTRKVTTRKVTTRKVTTKKVSTRKATSKKAAAKKSTKAASKTKASKKSTKSLSAAIKVKSSTKKASAKKEAPKGKKSIALKLEKTAIKKPLVPTPSVKVLKSFRKAAQAKRQLVKERAKQAKTSKDFLAKPPKKGKKYSIDLRIHSPGTIGYFTAGGVEPGPALVRLAKVKGLDIVGLTDFYNPSYIDSVQSTAKNLQITIIPGMDMRCRVEGCAEVFITALFPEHYTSSELFAVLDRLEIPESAKGNKDYCIEKPFSQVLEVVESLGGVVIPSRLDKTPYRQLAIPALVEKYGIHAFDLVHPDNPEIFKQHWPTGKFTFFSFSNAQALAQIGNRALKVKLEAPGFEGLKSLVQRRTDVLVSSA